MELSQGKDKTSKFTSQNFISNIPDNVVADILDRLPLQDAVRTSFLSRNWRFKWTLLSQLVFDRDFFKYLLKRRCGSDYGRIISWSLLHCAIKKFVLYIEGGDNCAFDDEVINKWMLFLSRKGIKDLTLYKKLRAQIKLHPSLFSWVELKHLKLHNCSFDPPVSFHGFPNLVKLELSLVNLESGNFGEFITQCPLLEILEMCRNNSAAGKLKLGDFAKLTNLKTLTLSLRDLDDTIITSPGSIFELVGFLPKLQELCLDFKNCKFEEDGVEKKFSATFPWLKTLKLLRIDSGIGMNLSCAFEMIRNFPDLQTLEISASKGDKDPTPGIGFPEVDYNKTGLLKLRNVVIYYFKDLDGELRFLKYLLACSPFLEKLVIHPHPSIVYHGKLPFAMKLLKLHRASPVAEIDLCED